jgi:rhodanese-related sulfurtransferase
MQDLINFIAHHSLLSLAFVFVFILIIGIEWIRARRNTFNLTPLQITQKINHDHAVVIDLRTKDSYLKGHIIDAHSLSTADMKQTPKKIEKFRTRPLILVGETGLEAQKMAVQLLKQGYNAYSLQGGMRAWIEAQMPVIKNNNKE